MGRSARAGRCPLRRPRPDGSTARRAGASRDDGRRTWDAGCARARAVVLPGAARAARRDGPVRSGVRWQSGARPGDGPRSARRSHEPRSRDHEARERARRPGRRGQRARRPSRDAARCRDGPAAGRPDATPALELRGGVPPGSRPMERSGPPSAAEPPGGRPPGDLGVRSPGARDAAHAEPCAGPSRGGTWRGEGRRASAEPHAGHRTRGEGPPRTYRTVRRHAAARRPGAGRRRGTGAGRAEHSRDDAVPAPWRVKRARSAPRPERDHSGPACRGCAQGAAGREGRTGAASGGFVRNGGRPGGGAPYGGPGPRGREDAAPPYSYGPPGPCPRTPTDRLSGQARSSPRVRHSTG